MITRETAFCFYFPLFAQYEGQHLSHLHYGYKLNFPMAFVEFDGEGGGGRSQQPYSSILAQNPAALPPRRSVSLLAKATIGLPYVYRNLGGRRSSVASGERGLDFADAQGRLLPSKILPLLGGRYRCGGILGEGTFSTILCGADAFRKGRTVALKVMDADFGAVGLREARCLRFMHSQPGGVHVPVVHLWDSFIFCGHYCLVLEQLGCSLCDFVGRKHHQTPSCYLTAEAIRSVALQMLSAIIFMHRHGFIHADLKPENILMVQQEQGEVLPQIKLVDFGNCVRIVETSLYYDDFEIQTLAYRAPEVSVGCPFSPAIDVYAAGVILAELALGSPLFVSAPDRRALLRQTACALGPLPQRRFRTGRYFSECCGGGDGWADREEDIGPMGCCMCCPRRKAAVSCSTTPTSADIKKEEGEQDASAGCVSNCVAHCRFARSRARSAEAGHMMAHMAHVHRILAGAHDAKLRPQHAPAFCLLLGGLLQQDPDKRLSALQAVMHDYFGSVFPFRAALGPGLERATSSSTIKGTPSSATARTGSKRAQPLRELGSADDVAELWGLRREAVRIKREERSTPLS